MADATRLASYSQTFAATGTAPITWSVTAGALPVGLSLDPTTGVLAGTPIALGSSNFTITATNLAGSASQACQLTVVSQPTLTAIAPATAPIGATVRLSGSGFDPTPANNTVTFGATSAVVLAATASELRVEVPAIAAGTVAVTVTVGALASGSFSYPVDATVVRFVDASATGGNDGSSWTDAFQNLSAALAAATSGDEVWVAAGTYLTGAARTDTFTLVGNAPVYGGFDGDEGALAERDPVAHRVVLTGDILGDDTGINFSQRADNAYHIVTAPAHTTLDGVTVRGSFADGGGTSSDGGGVYASGAGVVLRNVTFEWNRAADDGGAVFAASTLTCEDCVFVDNYGSDAGAAIYADGGTLTLRRCVFRDNFASLATVTTFATQALFAECVFAANDSWNVGSIWNNSTAEVRGCTFWGNTATGTKGITTNEPCTVRDSIFWGGTAGRPWFLKGPAGSISAQTCTFEGGLPGGTSNLGGNLSLDPQFVDTADLEGPDGRWATADDGLGLGAASPALDTATTAGASATDVAGTARPQGVGVDMGAYERL